MIARLRKTQLALAFRAIKCRAPSLDHPGDDSATPLPLTWRPFAIVDLEDVLKITQFSIGLPMIAQGRAAGFDGLLEHGANRLGDSGCGAGRAAARVRQDARGPRRRQTGAEQSLAHIDVAKPRDPLLVEER